MFSVGSVEKPIVIITGVKFADLCLILDFAYMGQASIPQDRLDDFLKAGELLQIRGLKEGRIHFMTKHVHTYPQQSSPYNRSFDSTITSTQEQPAEAPPVKRPREDDEVSIQEATEIMKMLLDSSELDNEQAKGQAMPQFTVGSPISAPQSNGIVLMRTQSAAPPQRQFFGTPPGQSQQEPTATATKEKQTFICRFCGRRLTTAGRIRKHENECADNPDRVIAVCEICKSEMKPSSLTQHKKQKHDIKIKNTPQNLPSLPITDSTIKGAHPLPIQTRALALSGSRTQLNNIDTTRPSPEANQGRSSTSDADSPDELCPIPIAEIKEEENHDEDEVSPQ